MAKASKQFKLNSVAKCCILALGMGSTATFAQQQDDRDKEIEVIEVSSIQESLTSAMNLKRATDNITEVINAEDVGKLPDDNLAEVLENIAGVQIDRTSGVGSNVSIRGSDQNRVEINGRGTTPSGDARGGISFEDLPASLIASVVVTKVPTADMVEGSLGGTVDLKTYRGLSITKPIKSVTVKSAYAENRDDWGPSVSGTYGNKFETGAGDVGVVISASHQKSLVREDSLNVRVGPRTNTDLDQFGGPGDGDLDTPDPYIRPQFAQQFFGIEDRTNNAFNASFEWQAQDNLKLFLDGTMTESEIDRRGHGAFLGLPQARAELDNLATATFDVFNYNDVSIPMITSAQIDGIQLRTTNSSLSRTTDSSVFAIGGEWDVSENIDVVMEASFSDSETESPQFTLVSQFQDPNAADILKPIARQRINFFYDIRDNLAYGPAEDFTGDLSDPNNYAVFVGRDAAMSFANEDNAQRIDVTWHLDSDVLSNIEFGVRANQRESSRNRISQVSGNWPGLAQGTLEPFLSQTPTDFFDFNDGRYLEGFLTGDPVQFKDLTNIRDSLNISLAPDPDRTQYFQVTEDTVASYAKVNFDSDIADNITIKGNVGVRVINTDQVASGYQITQGVPEDINAKQSYTETLPSFSLAVGIDDNLLVRLGGAKILRRPNFGDLSPTVTFPLNNNAVRGGNPNLKPTTANQFDLGVEYYFDKSSYLSAGVFFKDLDGVIGSEVTPDGIYNPNAVDPDADAGDEPGMYVDLISPVNQTGGEIKGVELAFQHTMTWLPSPFDGFGILANFTHQEGSRDATFKLPGFLNDTGDVVELPLNFRGLSENAYNFTTFYEKGAFSARLRYTYRDGFLRTEATDLSNSNPFYNDDRGQLNASVSYDINENVAVSFSGVNLTKETFDERAIFMDGPMVQQRDADRRVVLGVRARF